MKLREIFRFEFLYQIRTPWPWLFTAVLIVLNFLMTRDARLSEALYEEFFINSPFAIAKTSVFGNLLWLVMAAFVAGDAASRDVYTRMHPLVYTTPIHKWQYLTGKFLACFVINALILTTIQLAIMLAVYAPGVDPTIVAPFSLLPYFTAYIYIGLPTAFAATSIQFAFASLTGRPMSSYAGSVLLVFMGFFVASLLLFHHNLGTLLDPIGIRFIVEDIAHAWTTAEKKIRLLEFEGIILKNRLFWIAIGTTFLTVTYFHFRFKHRVWLGWKVFNKHIAKATDPAPSNTSETRITFQPSFSFSTALRKTAAIAAQSFKTLALSRPGMALLGGIPLLTIPMVIDQMEPHSGNLVPTTIRVLSELTGPLSAELSRWVIIPAFIIFFAGELVWREREARVEEIIDTMPGSNWPPLLGKYLGLVSVVVLFLIMQMLAGIIAQVTLNYTHFEISLYLKVLFGFQLTEYALFASVVMAAHVIVNQKYAGHMVAILIYVFIAVSQLFGIKHNLLVFGASPPWSYTDMRGFGNSVEPWLWFKFYWLAWAIVIMFSAKLFWVRGVKHNLRARISSARQQLSGATKFAAALSLTSVFVLGGFIFYNTNIRNEYLTDSQLKARQAEYEIQFGKYKSFPQPSLRRAKVQIELYNDKQTATIKGAYLLTNVEAVSIDSIHVATVSGFETQISFDRSVTQEIKNEALHHTIYTFQKPLLPGDSVTLNFSINIEPNGFRSGTSDNAIVSNGTYFSNANFPTIGYNEGRELIHAHDRREYGLPLRPIIASLYDTTARKQKGSGIELEAVIGTDQGQQAVAPGRLIKHWTSDNRNYFHYKTDGVIGNEWSFASAHYAVHEELWRSPDSAQKEVAISVFHLPEHTQHLDRMLNSIRASLDYYSKTFGPYRHDHLTIVEIPGNGTGLHAEATMVTHSEGFSLWNPENDSLTFDFPYAVVAHEMAHQWTVPYANVEGAPVMSESIAWYYGLKLVEHAKGQAHVKKLLQEMRQPQPYPAIRRGEPLLRGLDPYLSYRRGPFALYTLSEYIGENNLNGALRNLLEVHRAPGARPATTLDLFHHIELVTPDSMRYLLHDLFEVNTYWDLEAKKPTAMQAVSQKWQVAFNIEAHKIVADTAGVETEIPMNDWIQIGVFAENGAPLYLQKHLITTSGIQSIGIELNEKPASLAIDPNHLMIDLKPENNFTEVKITH